MTTPVAAALFLSRRVPVIACREDAGVCFVEVRKAIDDIERMINRAIPPRFLGPCPTLIAHHQACATQLTAKRNAAEVTCPSCKITHQVDYLIDVLLNELAYHPFTATQLLGKRTSEMPGILEDLRQPVPRSTLYLWIKKGRLLPCGYLSVVGVFSAMRLHDTDEAAYYLRDVRRLRGDLDAVSA